MSPEQAKGLKTLDHRTDIWSLGAVLYEALTGRPPFSELETFGQLILAICSRAPPALDRLAPDVSPLVAAIVERAMQIEPDDRFATADDMLANITALLPDGIEIRDVNLVGLTGEVMPFERPAPPPRTRREGARAPDVSTPAPNTLKSLEPPEVGSPRATTPISPRREPDSAQTLPSAGSSRNGARAGNRWWMPTTRAWSRPWWGWC